VPMSVPDTNADIQMPSVLSAGDTALQCLNQYELLLKSCMKGAYHRAACCNGPTRPVAGGLNRHPCTPPPHMFVWRYRHTLHPQSSILVQAQNTWPTNDG
jgi:hypothetical protein